MVGTRRGPRFGLAPSIATRSQGGGLPGYFVDAVNGNDSNSGKYGSPWKTIAKVNASTFSPGDYIWFKRGQTWREQLTVPSSGSAGKPITICAYGAGDAPKIIGSDTLTGFAAATDFPADSYTATTSTSGSGNLRYNSTNQQVAFKFTAGSTYSLSKLSSLLYRVGAPSGTISVSIYSDNSNKPGTNLGTSSSTVDAGSLATVWGTAYTWTWSSPVSITSGAVYWIVFTGTFAVSTANYVNISINTTGNVGVSRYNGTTWTTTAAHAGYFVTYGSAPANTWALTLATAPNYATFDGGVKAPVATPSALLAQGDWVWAGGTFYLKSTTNPASAYSSIQAAQRDYCIYAPDRSYLTIDGLDLSGANGLANLMCGAGSGSTGVTVQNCEIHHGKQTGLYFWGVANGVARNNYIHHIWDGRAYPSGTGQGISLYGTPTQNCQIMFNKIELNFRGVFLYGAAGTANPTGTVIAYNIVKNSLVNGIDQFQVNAAANPTLVYGNTVIHCPAWSVGHGIDMQDTAADGIKIKNNIIVGTFTGTNNNVQLVSISSSVAITSVDIDNNLYFKAPGYTGNVAKQTSGAVYSTLAAWQAFLSGTGYGGKDVHSLSSDPLFADLEGGDYSLQAGSPAVDAGANLGASYINALAAGSTWPGGVSLIAQGAAWDIGAYARAA